MVSFIAMVLSLIFVVLAMIHFSWALGSNWGFKAALPTKADGKWLINPRPVDSALVGVGLLAFGSFYICLSPLIDCSMPSIFSYGRWGIAVIFLMRAMGDFKYVGFFKKVKNTRFAKMDNRIFSPLCLLISILGFILSLWSN